MVSRNEMPKPTSQPVEVGRVSTIELILSVTVAKVCPGSMTGARPLRIATGSSLIFLTALRRRFEPRVRVANHGQVGGPRPDVQVGQQAVVAMPGFEL